MRRWPTVAVRVGLVLLAGGTLVRSEPARAEDAAPTSTLGGYEGSAGASGLRVVYNPEGILPIPPPVDLSSPDALATIAEGPSTFARAAILDPGDLLANPDALLTQASADYPAGAIPPYPFRISVSSGSGPATAKLTPAPGLDSSVSALATTSQADASTPRVTAPAIVTVGTAKSHASTRTDGSSVTVEASASLSDIDLLGLLRIASVSTDLTVTSDGAKTATSGGTVITGASILGQPVVIDANGIRAQPGGGGVENTAVTAVNELLKMLGLRVTVASPIKQEAPEAGQLISAGLRIDLEVSNKTYPQVGQLLDQLPPLPTLVPGAPGLDDVLALARARHLLTIGIGQAEVSLGARQDGAVPVDAPAGSVDLPLDLPAGSPDPVDFGSGTTPTVASVPPRPVGARSTADSGSPGFAEGIGVLAVLGLLVQPLLADRISRGAALLLSADPTDACPREGT
jgi:hypothetical protein